MKNEIETISTDDTINFNAETKEISVSGRAMAIILFVGLAILVILFFLMTAEDGIADILLGYLSANS